MKLDVVPLSGEPDFMDMRDYKNARWTVKTPGSVHV